MPFVSSSSKPGIHVAWKTVTYRSVALGVLFAAVVLFVGMNFAFPQFTQKSVKSVTNLGGRLLEMVAGGAEPPRLVRETPNRLISPRSTEQYGSKRPAAIAG